MVLGVEHHALAGAEPQHRLAGGRRRHPFALLDTHGTGRFGVLQGRGKTTGVFQLEPDTQHHEAVGFGLEATVPVRECALVIRDGDRFAGVPVVGDDLRDGRRHLLSVRTDVLDRRRARGAGDSGQAFDTGEAGFDGPGHGVRPDLPGGQLQRGAGQLEPLGRDAQGGAVEALVADDQVAAAADDEERRTAVVGLAHGCDHLGVGRRREEAGRGAAEPEGGQGARGRRGVPARGQEYGPWPHRSGGATDRVRSGPRIRRRPGPVPQPAPHPPSGPTPGPLRVPEPCGGPGSAGRRPRRAPPPRRRSRPPERSRP